MTDREQKEPNRSMSSHLFHRPAGEDRIYLLAVPGRHAQMQSHGEYGWVPIVTLTPPSLPCLFDLLEILQIINVSGTCSHSFAFLKVIKVKNVDQYAIHLHNFLTGETLFKIINSN
jgi:hypothetical protein